MKQSQYEITYLIDPKLSEEERGAVETSTNDLITKLDGSVITSTPTLRKKLAYEIRRNNTAFLRAMHIELDPANIAKIHDFLKREATVLRFTILATQQRPRISKEILDKYDKNADKDKSGKHGYKKPEAAAPAQKEVTMKDVEKGIEEALTEEIK